MRARADGEGQRLSRGGVPNGLMIGRKPQLLNTFTLPPPTVVPLDARRHWGFGGLLVPAVGALVPEPVVFTASGFRLLGALRPCVVAAPGLLVPVVFTASGFRLAGVLWPCGIAALGLLGAVVLTASGFCLTAGFGPCAMAKPVVKANANPIMSILRMRFLRVSLFRLFGFNPQGDRRFRLGSRRPVCRLVRGSLQRSPNEAIAPE
jgi:hypothetical protein